MQPEDFPRWVRVLLVPTGIILALLIVLLVVELAGYIQAPLPVSAEHTAISSAIATLIAGTAAVFGVAVAVIAGLYAKEQLLLGRRIALSDTLLRIDEALKQHQVVHTKLRPGGEWSWVGPDGKRRKKVDGPAFPEDGPAVESYMGLFERVQVFVEGKIVDIGKVDRLYGYRLSNIVANPNIFKEKLVDNAYGWADFTKLWEALADHRKKSTPEDPLVKQYACWLSIMKQ